MKQLQWLVGHPYFCKTTYDQLAFGFFVFGTHLAMWYEIWIVMPYYHGHLYSFRYVHYAAVFVIYVNAMSNLYKLVIQKIDQPHLDTAGDNSNKHYCARCMLYAAPRSHHCRVCDVCVPKRDHHCWFAGVCVGWHNQRYFVVMLLWVWIAALYGNIYHFQFVTEVVGFSFGTLLCVLAPHVAALLGYLSLAEFFICILTLLAALLLVMFTWMLQIQLTQIYFGQTKYERKSYIKDYDFGVMQNIREVFGERWYATFVSAWIPSQLPGNGYQYVTSIKTM